MDPWRDMTLLLEDNDCVGRDDRMIIALTCGPQPHPHPNSRLVHSLTPEAGSHQPNPLLMEPNLGT